VYALVKVELALLVSTLTGGRAVAPLRKEQHERRKTRMRLFRDEHSNHD
jgi:hypothetical protein